MQCIDLPKSLAEPRLGTTDLINLEFPEKTPKNALRYLCSFKTGAYSEISILLSRILVCKPHSADCERLISAYNKLKTQERSLYLVVRSVIIYTFT